MNYTAKCILCAYILLLLPLLANWDAVGSTKSTDCFDHLREEISVIPVHLIFGDEGFLFPDLALSVQKQLDKEVSQRYPESDVKIQLINNLIPKQKLNDDARSKNLSSDNYVIEIILGGENAIFLDPNIMKVTLFYEMEAVHSNDLPFLVTQTILDHLLAAEFSGVYTGLSQKNTEKRPLLFHLRGHEGDDILQANIQGALESYLKPIKELNIEVIILNSTSSHEIEGAANIFIHLNDEVTIDCDNCYQVFIGNISSNDLNSMKTELKYSLRSVFEEELGLPRNSSNNLKLKLAPMMRSKVREHIKFTKLTDEETLAVVSRYSCADLLNLRINNWWFFLEQILLSQVPQK